MTEITKISKLKLISYMVLCLKNSVCIIIIYYRRKTTDTNLLEETCSHSISSWGGQELPMYCICNSYYIKCTDKDKCKDEPMENATCSPSPYFNCTFTRQKTDLCEDYHDRCNDAARHKRSVSPDPEQEIKDKTKRLLDMQNKRGDRIQVHKHCMLSM